MSHFNGRQHMVKSGQRPHERLHKLSAKKVRFSLLESLSQPNGSMQRDWCKNIHANMDSYVDNLASHSRTTAITWTFRPNVRKSMRKADQ